MVRHLKALLPWAVSGAIGLTMAAVFVPTIMATLDWYAGWDEINNPPATLAWNSVERVDRNVLRITLLVTRHKDCQMVRALAYSGDSLSAMQPVESFTREDGLQPQSYPVGISVVSRPWVMRGVYGGKLAISTYYDCSDRIVRAPLLIGDAPP